jgi:hypothetical protein
MLYLESRFAKRLSFFLAHHSFSEGGFAHNSFNEGVLQAVEYLLSCGGVAHFKLCSSIKLLSKRRKIHFKNDIDLLLK